MRSQERPLSSERKIPERDSTCPNKKSAGGPSAAAALPQPNAEAVLTFLSLVKWLPPSVECQRPLVAKASHKSPSHPNVADKFAVFGKTKPKPSDRGARGKINLVGRKEAAPLVLTYI